ncbi:STAS domain-containing protein [Ammoniphilus sp. YIM 78166]|uniref:STAS domain-containing protein n=1 Tax=Ammoniphilus sp. YIM 78166 TaxID=1644106 RepID=UPI00106F490F|nr:STAS domain-containing protein [Ammoniphilus sp. YIM 78166]
MLNYGYLELVYIKGENLNQFIEQNLSVIISEWNQSSGKGKFFQSSKATPSSLQESFENLFLIIGKDMPGIREEELIQWAQDIGRRRAQSDFPIHYSLELFTEFRDIFWKTLNYYLQQSQETLSAKKVFEWERYYNKAIDMVIYHFASNYVAQKNELIRFQQITVEELSVPLIPITHDTSVLSIVGAIDHARSTRIMDQTFNHVSQVQIRNLIMDITAAHFLDHQVVKEVLKLVQGLRLLGCDTIVTGIKPDIAKMMVQQGLDITEKIQSKATIKQAIESLHIIQNESSSTFTTKGRKIRSRY